MFDHIVLRRSESGDPISAGQLAEALLYYQKVHIFIDKVRLSALLRQIGPELLITLLRRPDVSAVFCEEILATHTQSVGVSQRHNFIAVTLSGDQNGGPLNSPHARLEFQLHREGMSRRQAHRFTQTFFGLVAMRKYTSDHFLPGGIVAAAKQDLLDINYARLAFAKAVEAAPCGHTVEPDYLFDIVDVDAGTFVITDIDFDTINRRRASSVPVLEPLTTAHVLTNILDARADVALSAFYGGDFVTSAATSAIIQLRHTELLRRAKLNANAQREFVEVVLPDSASVAEVVDSGERTFDEFLKLLDHARRFKSWVTSVNPDEGMIRTYMRDVTAEGWIQKLPAKTLRYLIALGIDAAIPAAGVATGLIDNFLVDKLLSGWRPNHFVSKRLGPFVRT